MKQHEEVKLNDFEAHRQVALRNTREANAKLEKVLAKIADAQKNLTALHLEITKAAKEFDGLSLRLKNITGKIQEESASLKRAKDDHSEAESLHKENLNKLKEHHTQTNERVSTLVSRIVELVIERDALNKEISSLRAELVLIQTSVEGKKKQIKELQEEISDLLRNLDILKEQHGREMLSRNGELHAILEKIEVEKRKIEQPMKMLDARELDISRREYDFRVMYSRLKYHWEKLYPGQNLNI